MRNPWTLISPRTQLSHPQYDWEQHGKPKVNEGPEVIKHAGKTFLVYSASFCGTDDYALGMLTISDKANQLDTSSFGKNGRRQFLPKLLLAMLMGRATTASSYRNMAVKAGLFTTPT
jgi:GH43 family beta-xylosidase